MVLMKQKEQSKVKKLLGHLPPIEM